MRIRFLSGKTLWPLIIMGTLLFIAWGDAFLPHPLSDYSRNTRKKIQNILIGSFPQRDKDRRDLSEQREEQIKKWEKKAKP
jgi:hypothetical protein